MDGCSSSDDSDRHTGPPATTPSEENEEYPEVKQLPKEEQKRILVTGGAGFLGSHLVDRLMREGHRVTVVDNFFTGRTCNIQQWLGHPDLRLLRHDVINPLHLDDEAVQEIYHLACASSPVTFLSHPVETIKTNTMGTVNMLELAKEVGAKLLLTSTSEVYGDPLVVPQTEDYWGHVNPIGPRSCYDEGKRAAEAMCYAYHKQFNVPVRVARVSNTYGPRMPSDGGGVVGSFVMKALQNEPLQLYGDGSQSRTFQYVSDLVEGLILLMDSDYVLPVNMAAPDKHTIIEFADIVLSLTGSTSPIVTKPAREDDPKQRQPDTSRAVRYLGWRHKVPLQQGLRETIAYYRATLNQEKFSRAATFDKKDAAQNDSAW